VTRTPLRASPRNVSSPSTTSERSGRSDVAVLGLIGGMSWHASALYYQRLNQQAERRYGEGATVEAVLVTLRFSELLAAAQVGDWEKVNGQIRMAAQRCVDAGANLLMITAFTGHSAAAHLESNLPVPLVHAADALFEAVPAGACVGLLGTQFMLNAGVIEQRLREKGLTVVTPEASVATRLNGAILDDLTSGNLSVLARGSLVEAVANVRALGASRVLLACTELPLLLDDMPPDPSLVDGVAAHVETALNRMETLQ
jgi:aspartate racemase